MLIEDKASGTQLIQELVRERCHWVKAYQSQNDKVMRLHAQTGRIENGFVYLPKKASWLADYLHELLAFPSGRFDDQVDSTAQALDWVGQDNTAAVWKEFMEQGVMSTGRRGVATLLDEYVGPMRGYDGFF